MASVSTYQWRGVASEAIAQAWRGKSGSARRAAAGGRLGGAALASTMAAAAAQDGIRAANRCGERLRHRYGALTPRRRRQQNCGGGKSVKSA